ncbi:MAG: DUF485 domain-containing protein [Polyangiaceae bacterium]
MSASPHEALAAVTQRRQTIAMVLTGIMMAAYFGFILLVAFDKPLLGTLIGRGLSLGIALGAAVIVVAWIVTGVYVYWANKRYDSVAADARRASEEAS